MIPAWVFPDDRSTNMGSKFGAAEPGTGYEYEPSDLPYEYFTVDDYPLWARVLVEVFRLVAAGASPEPLVDGRRGLDPVCVRGEAPGVVAVLVVAVAMQVDEPDDRRGVVDLRVD